MAHPAAPLATVVTSLSQAEFNALVPSIGAHGTPLPPQFVARKAGTINCDVLGAALFVRGDCWPIKAALKAFGFRFNASLKQWEAPFALDTVQSMMRWCVGTINISFSPEVRRRAQRVL